MTFMSKAPGDPALGDAVVDDEGDRVGKISAVVYDEMTMEPEWMAVKTGMLGGAHYVPFAGSSRDRKGNVVVHYPKWVIEKAPRVARDRVLTREARDELREYYPNAA
jgi:hypothetical protein